MVQDGTRAPVEWKRRSRKTKRKRANAIMNMCCLDPIFKSWLKTLTSATWPMEPHYSHCTYCNCFFMGSHTPETISSYPNHLFGLGTKQLRTGSIPYSWQIFPPIPQVPFSFYWFFILLCKRELFSFFLYFFFLSFEGITHGIWRFLGQRLNQSCS